MQPYEIKIPFGVLINLHKSVSEAVEDIKQQAAIRYYKKRILSLGKAAELAGMNRLEFIDYLRFNNEIIFEYSDEELDEINNDSMMLERILE